MAENVLALEKRMAGAEYLAALRALDLEPEALFWAQDAVVGTDVLVLVTSLFDQAGPLDLSQTLFRAYERSATPRAVDPFILRLHSPNHSAIRDMVSHFGSRIAPPVHLDEAYPKAAPERIRVAGLSMGGDVLVYTDGIYRFDLSGKVVTLEASRRWCRFRDRVERLAA